MHSTELDRNIEIGKASMKLVLSESKKESPIIRA